MGPSDDAPHRCVLPGQDAFTLLADGSIATFGPRAHESGCAVHRLARGVLSTYPTWLCGGALTLVLRTGGTDSIYTVHSKEIRRLRFGGPELEVDATFEIPVASYSNRGQMFSLDDGRIVAPGEGISILEPGKAAVRRPMPKVFPRHLARATAERFWYSRAGRTYNVFDALVLAHLDAPEVNPQTRTFAPSRIVHVASHESAIAVLLMSPAVKNYSRRLAEDTWHVAVVSEAGTERWRAEVPRQPRPYDLNYTANEFMEFTKAQDRGTAATAHYLLTHPRVAVRVAKVLLAKPKSVRTLQYWAANAYKHGAVAVKYSAQPCAGTPAPAAVTGDSFLRADLKPQLAAGTVCFDVFAQKQLDSVAQSVEDGTSVWDPAQSPPVRIARLIIPATALDTAATNAVEATCNNLSFNPWNSAPEYRPLGHMNRSRKFAYEASTKMRNAAPEPTTIPGRSL